MLSRVHVLCSQMAEELGIKKEFVLLMILCHIIYFPFISSNYACINELHQVTCSPAQVKFCWWSLQRQSPGAFGWLDAPTSTENPHSAPPMNWEITSVYNQLDCQGHPAWSQNTHPPAQLWWMSWFRWQQYPYATRNQYLPPYSPYKYWMLISNSAPLVISLNPIQRAVLPTWPPIFTSQKLGYFYCQ